MAFWYLFLLMRRLYYLWFNFRYLTLFSDYLWGFFFFLKKNPSGCWNLWFFNLMSILEKFQLQILRLLLPPLWFLPSGAPNMLVSVHSCMPSSKALHLSFIFPISLWVGAFWWLLQIYFLVYELSLQLFFFFLILCLTHWVLNVYDFSISFLEALLVPFQICLFLFQTGLFFIIFSFVSS